jgi:N6-L-threonylcarbamoyladenine synthase
MLILGIESTCDETAAAVVRDGRRVLSSCVASQIDLHAKYGGVVPEIAARAHLECMNALVDEALTRAGIRGTQLDGVAVAHAPGLIGCLLVGVAAAKALAFAWEKPLLAVNHVQAHLYSVLLEDEQTEAAGSRVVPEFPALGLVISGGHSSIYHVTAYDRLVRIGATHDDAVGEAFDKVASILQLGYPGGPLIDQLAREGNDQAINFPLSMLEKDSLDFSFSGIKTSVLYHVNGKQGRQRDASSLMSRQKADVAASFQRAAATMLVEKLRRAAARYPARSLLIGGGVSANSVIRRRLTELGAQLGLPVFVPPLRYCTDNAAMTAGLGYQLLRAGKVAGLELEAVATT